MMRLRCDGIFNQYFIPYLLLCPLVKEFWKSVNVWQNCGQEWGILFFDWHGILMIFANIPYLLVVCSFSGSSGAVNDPQEVADVKPSANADQSASTSPGYTFAKLWTRIASWFLTDGVFNDFGKYYIFAFFPFSDSSGAVNDHQKVAVVKPSANADQSASTSSGYC